MYKFIFWIFAFKKFYVEFLFLFEDFDMAFDIHGVRKSLILLRFLAEKSSCHKYWNKFL